MASRALVRSAVAAAVSISLAGVIGPLSGPAHADTAPSAPVVIPAGARYAPRGDTFVTASADGYLHQQEGVNGYQWTSYDTGATTPATPGTFQEVSAGEIAQFVPATRQMQVRDAATDAVRYTVTLPVAERWTGGFGGQNMLTQERVTGTPTVVHLVSPQDGGGLTERTLSGLDFGDGAVTIGLAQDAHGAVVVYTTSAASDAVRHLAYIDFDTATATPILQDVTGFLPYVVLSQGYIVDYGGSTTAYVVRRDDPSAAVKQVTVPADAGGYAQFAVVGDWLLTPWYDPKTSTETDPLAVVSLRDSTPRYVLLDTASPRMITAPDGTALVVGGRDSAHWAVQRVVTGDDGKPQLVPVADVPPVAATVYGLTLSADRLQYGTNTSQLRTLLRRDLAVTGAPEADDPHVTTSDTGWGESCPGVDSTGQSAGVPCAQLQGLGDDRVAYVDGTDVMSPSAESPVYFNMMQVPATGGRIVDGSGRYVVVDVRSTQYVGDFEQGYDSDVLMTRPVTAAAVWGSTLWVTGSTQGTVSSIDLKTKKTVGVLATGAPCVPAELQAVGRWIYWSCGTTGPAGVYDRTAAKSIAVPSGEALLGDGYLVRHDTGTDADAGKLLLTDFHTGTAVTRDLADLPKGALDDDRGITWTVDKYGGDVAYADDQQQIHIVPTGVPTQNLTAIESHTVPTVGRSTPYGPIWASWQLSKPASGWSLTVRNSLGRVVDTVTGGATRGSLVTEWGGLTSTGALAPNGTYSWTLTAQPADGFGPAMVRTGKAAFTKGAAVRRDYGNDGIGDLLTMNSSGGLTVQQGTGTGKFGAKTSGSGWPVSSLVVPVGDMNGDRCDDLLVRSSSGTLTRYNGGCGTAFTPSTKHVSLGTGWNQYNVLTSPGDLTGDGRADLIARQTSTGDVYLYADNGTGKFTSRVKIASNWTGYTKIVGAGDLNGDGTGDLLARDKHGSLWRYYGKATGGFTARVRIATDWGGSYNAIVGVGDITGDGKADIVERDTSGNLWRNTGTGGLRPRVRIATGWQGYKGVF
ncbi:FG-GAP-like repeat-containing protein [Streptomyces sp. NPDC059373]